VATAAAWVARSRVAVVVKHSVPLQTATAALQHELEQLSGILDDLGAAQSLAEVATSQNSYHTLLAQHQQTVAELASLGESSEDSLTIAEASFGAMQTLAQAHIASEAEITACRQLTAQDVQNAIAAANTWNKTVSAVQATAQQAVSSALSASTVGNERIKRLLAMREQTAQASALIAQITATESRHKLSPFTDRMAAVGDSIQSNLQPEEALSARMTPLLLRLQAGISGDDGLLAGRKALLALPATAEASDLTAARAAQQICVKEVLSVVEEARSAIGETIDDLELSVVNANRTTGTALDHLFQAVALSGEASQMGSLVRAIATDAAMLAEVTTPAEQQRLQLNLGNHLDELAKVLKTMVWSLKTLAGPVSILWPVVGVGVAV
jgi:hypothetical protein